MAKSSLPNCPPNNNRAGRRRIPLTPGEKFGRLSYVADAPSVNARRRAVFLCDCGKEIECDVHNVRYGHTRSCGCLIVEIMPNLTRTHGATQGRGSTPEYRAWRSMRERCSNPHIRGFHNYGGRGIKVCDRWLEFENFLADMGERPSPIHTLDRIDVDGHYEPGNCRWATHKEQMQNTRLTHFIEIDGVTKSLHDWADHYGISPKTVWNRIRRGWSDIRALTEPIDVKKRNRDSRRAGDETKV